jgi:glycosyltransferase involved in cell wall biosynthesis
MSAALMTGLLLYPLASFLRARLLPDPVRKDPAFQPPVSILIACYNEERYITERLDALLDAGEWIPGSQLIVVSTGSTDGTNELLLRYSEREDVLILLEGRMTKIEALNDAIRFARHDYLVFSDCRQYMLKGSVKALISNLNDPRVGTVSCTILDTENNSSFFRRLYLSLAAWDSRSGSAFNLYGALYAQRRDVFRPIPDHLLFDDFFVAVSTLAQRKRLVQEQNAVLYDVPFPTYYNRERIERLARGLLIFLFNNSGLIRRIPLATRCRFFAYKYLKLILPVLLVCLILSGAFLFSEVLFHPQAVTAELLAATVLLAWPRSRRMILLTVVSTSISGRRCSAMFF